MKELIDDRYKILRTLGKGAFGQTYLALDQALHKQVVVKLFSAKYLKDAKSRDRFRREVLTVSHLNHPNIVNIYECRDTGTSCYIVTDFVEGKSLRERIKDGDIDKAEALSVATQVADALKHIHQAGILHRDLRPENILLGPDGVVKLTDLSVGDLTETLLNELAPVASLGSIKYRAPEQIRGQRSDPRSDLWSLGVVLYEMTMHEQPFRGKSSNAIAEAILKGKPAFREIQDSELKKIVIKALQKPVNKRYQSALAMSSDLDRLPASASKTEVERKEIFARLWERFTESGTSETRGDPNATEDNDGEHSSADLYINLWLEDEHKSPVASSTVLSAGSSYTFLFAIENFSREDQGASTEFREPPELSEQPKTRVVIELLCPFLVTDDDSGYVRREVDYFAGCGFPPEEFTLKPQEAGEFYLTARLLIKGETIYREVLTLEVAPVDARASEVGALATASYSE